ncbi:hypothetical protein ABPG74_015598 [Tetrahymena malaccensis]
MQKNMCLQKTQVKNQSLFLQIANKFFQSINQSVNKSINQINNKKLQNQKQNFISQIRLGSIVNINFSTEIMSQKNSSSIQLDQMLVKNIQSSNISYKDYINTSIQEKYMLPCTAKCFVDYQSPLNGVEKVCLAKCIDRAADYHVISQSELNPVNKTNQKQLFKAFDIPVKN